MRTAGRPQPGDRRTLGGRILLSGLLASVIAAAFAAPSASAAGLSSQSLGVNISHNAMPADLTGGWPGSTGVGVARREVIDYTNWTTTTDSLVESLWKAGLRLAPDLGLPCPPGSSSQTSCAESASETPAQAASDMSNYVTAFAQRYGPGGTFWAGKPNPLPVEQYEIGDEPNIPIRWIEDATHLHWGNTDGSANTTDYAAVYQASRTALHAVGTCSGCETVVGGLADSGSYGVTLTQDEQILGAISGQVDAVAFHPYTWQTNNDFAAMESDVVLLRQWMSANGMSSSPIEINEFDACSSTGQGCYQQNVVSSSSWGAFVSSYTTWALCTPGLNVQSVMPFIWGDTSDAPSNFQTLVSYPAGTTTAYGQAFLATATALTTNGCPPPSSIPPVALPPGSPSGKPPVTVVVPTAGLRILHIHVHRSHVTLEIQVSYGTRSVKAIAIKGRHRIRLHVLRRRHGRTLLWLTAKLFRGKWTIKVTSVPPPGYAAPHARHRKVKIAR